MAKKTPRIRLTQAVNYMIDLDAIRDGLTDMFMSASFYGVEDSLISVKSPALETVCDFSSTLLDIDNYFDNEGISINEDTNLVANLFWRHIDKDATIGLFSLLTNAFGAGLSDLRNHKVGDVLGYYALARDEEMDMGPIQLIVDAFFKRADVIAAVANVKAKWNRSIRQYVRRAKAERIREKEERATQLLFELGVKVEFKKGKMNVLEGDAS